MIQQVIDKHYNKIIDVETYIQLVNDLGYEYRYIKCDVEVDLFYYTEIYDKLNDTDKRDFKLLMADAQKIPELIENRETKDVSEEELKRLGEIIKEYLTRIASAYDLKYRDLTVDY